MSIFKPENAAQSTEREAEIERERAEHDGTSESGTFENSASENRYGYGYDGERAEREEGAAESESEFGAAEEPRATTLSTAEPAATIGHDRADRDEEPLGSDEELSEDSMSGEAVRTQPQTTPMQPASVPETTSATPSAQSPLATDPGPVLAPEASLDFRERWHGIQAEFIDDPRRAVEDADRLVADVARAFATGVEERRRGLTSGWQNDEHGETEELRLTMRQYRALVDHILHD